MFEERVLAMTGVAHTNVVMTDLTKLCAACRQGPDRAPGPIASNPNGLMFMPASIGSGANHGNTCTFSFEIGSETRG